MFIDPQRIVAQLPLEPHMKVADLGAGIGLYTTAIAPRVHSGHVYAVEVQDGMLGRIKDEAHKRKLTNIEYIRGDVEVYGGTKLADHSIDMVLACNIFFQVEHKDIFIKEITRILKKGGYVCVVDWSDSYNNMGPAKKSIVTKDYVSDLFKSKGYEYVNDVDAGAHHYGIILLYK